VPNGLRANGPSRRRTRRVDKEDRLSGFTDLSGPDAFINMAAIILRIETALQLILEIENQCPVTQL